MGPGINKKEKKKGLKIMEMLYKYLYGVIL